MLIQAVLFDMDGLMFDTERLSQVAGVAACADFGYQLDDVFGLTLLGRAAADVDRLLSARFGERFPAPEVRARFYDYYGHALQKDGVPIKPGLEALLDWLEKMRIPTAVATSTKRELALKKLRAAAVLDRFSHVVGGDEVANSKPAPDIYLLAAERLGVDVRACFVLEDSEAGACAALEAKAQLLLVPDLVPPSAALLSRSVTVCASLYAVRDHLATVLSSAFTAP